MSDKRESKQENLEELVVSQRETIEELKQTVSTQQKIIDFFKRILPNKKIGHEAPPEELR